MNKKICFNRLSNTHLINKCKSKISCKIDGCKKRHHTILHSPNSLATNPSGINIITDTEVHSQNFIHQYRTNRTYLQIVSVKLMNKDIVVETNALLDTGSGTTLLRNNIATKLQLKGENRNLNINSALSHRKNVNSKITTFDINYNQVQNILEQSCFTPSPNRNVVFVLN